MTSKNKRPEILPPGKIADPKIIMSLDFWDVCDLIHMEAKQLARDTKRKWMGQLHKTDHRHAIIEGFERLHGHVNTIVELMDVDNDL